MSLQNETFLVLLGVPNLDLAVDLGNRGQSFAVRAESHVRDCEALPFEYGYATARVEVPYSNGPVIRRGRQSLAVLAERRATYDVNVSMENIFLMARLEIPHCHRVLVGHPTYFGAQLRVGTQMSRVSLGLQMR